MYKKNESLIKLEKELYTFVKFSQALAASHFA